MPTPAPLPSPADRLALLRGVSRSFYLSIRLLPAPLRDPVAVAYLLARATDTLADTTSLPTSERLAKLDALAAAIAGTSVPAGSIAALIASFAPLQQDEHERRLIQSLPHVLAWLAALPVSDREDVRTVLRHITRGQALDVTRFPAGSGVQALASAAELDEYTWLVAGCVGEFWTALGFRHLPRFAGLSEAHMRELGRSYGMGLQLINILRDAGADLATGRCYFPADALAAAGLTPQDITAQPARLEGIYQYWLQTAERRLADGMAYADALHSRRVRAASALPALVGTRTLALLRAAGPHALEHRVKVPRHEMRTLLLRLVLGLAGRRALARQFAQLGQPGAATAVGQSAP